MKILSPENVKSGIVLNSVFHCGLMSIGFVILQAWPNEGISQSSTYNHKIPFCKQPLCNVQILVIARFLSNNFLCQLCIFISPLTQKHCPFSRKNYSRAIRLKLKHRKISLSWMCFFFTVLTSGTPI